MVVQEARNKTQGTRKNKQIFKGFILQRYICKAKGQVARRSGKGNLD